MIVQQRRGLFGGRAATIHTPSFTCTVVTQREGIFRPFVTVINEGSDSQAGGPPLVVGRIAYFPESEKDDVHQLHEAIVQYLEEDGDRGCPLGAAIEGVMGFVRQEGMAAETINAAGWGAGTLNP